MRNGGAFGRIFLFKSNVPGIIYDSWQNSDCTVHTAIIGRAYDTTKLPVEGKVENNVTISRKSPQIATADVAVVVGWNNVVRA